MKIFTSALKSFSISFVSLTLVFLGIYGAVQQDLRQSANDPQTELAENAAAYLTSNSAFGAGNSSQLNLTNKVNLGTSLSTFIGVYDNNLKLFVTNAMLNNQDAIIPEGVLQTAVNDGRNTVTWQPQPGLRFAVVAVSFEKDGKKWVAVSGRSLRLVEERIDRIGLMLLIGYLLTLVAVFAAIYLKKLSSK